MLKSGREGIIKSFVDVVKAWANVLDLVA